MVDLVTITPVRRLLAGRPILACLMTFGSDVQAEQHILPIATTTNTVNYAAAKSFIDWPASPRIQKTPVRSRWTANICSHRPQQQ